MDIGDETFETVALRRFGEDLGGMSRLNLTKALHRHVAPGSTLGAAVATADAIRAVLSALCTHAREKGSKASDSAR